MNNLTSEQENKIIDVQNKIYDEHVMCNKCYVGLTGTTKVMAFFRIYVTDALAEDLGLQGFEPELTFGVFIDDLLLPNLFETKVRKSIEKYINHVIQPSFNYLPAEEFI